MREFLELSALIVFTVTVTAVSIVAVVHHALAADAAARRQGAPGARMAPAPPARPPGREVAAR
jgi:hypothetical protein